MNMPNLASWYHCILSLITAGSTCCAFTEAAVLKARHNINDPFNKWRIAAKYKKNRPANEGNDCAKFIRRGSMPGLIMLNNAYTQFPVAKTAQHATGKQGVYFTSLKCNPAKGSKRYNSSRGIQVKGIVA